MQQIDYQIDDFMLYCESKGLSKKTMASYKATLRLFARYLADNNQINDATEVTEIMIRTYIKVIQERGKYTFESNDKMKRTNCPENRSDFGKKWA